MAAPESPLAGRAYLRLVLLGALIGIPAALVAVIFLTAVHQLEDLLWADSPAWYLVLGLPFAGACIVLAARRLLPGDGGHSPLQGLGGGPVPIAYAPGIALAALGTLSFGAVLGPEAPLIALGSVVGVAATHLLRLGEKETAMLGNAGSFSAISALFGGPLVAAVLMVEGGIGMGKALLPAILPGFVAAAFGYLLFIGFGDWGGLEASTLAVPDLPPYDGLHLGELAIAVAVGVLTALAVAFVRRLGAGIDGPVQKRYGMPVVLLGGGLVVGLLALVADGLGADPQTTLFSGQSAIPDLIAESSAGALAVVLVAKALAYGVCLGCGFRGGPVFPAIFLGVGIATFAVIAVDMSPTLAVAVGAGAGMAAGTGLMVTSVLLAGLLAGRPGLDAVPVAVIAVAAAWLTAEALKRRGEPEA
jgi:H+/Cl- antiporter ClcA